VRVLRALETQYPTSKLAKNAAAEIARSMSTPVIPVGAELARPATAEHPKRASIATIKNITRAALPDAVRVTIELDAEVPFHEERLADPARVFVDLPSTRAAPSLLDQTLRFDGDADPVRQIRIGRHPNSTTRVVLDAVGVSSYSVYALYNPYRLVIDCARAGVAPLPPFPAAAIPPPPTITRAPALSVLPSHRLALQWGRHLPSITPRAADLIAAVRAPEPP